MSADSAAGLEWPAGEAPSIADEDRLTAWLDAQGLGAGAPLEHHYISGGSQNEIYELRRGDLHCAMRIPPPSASMIRHSRTIPSSRGAGALGGGMRMAQCRSPRRSS